MIAPTGRSLMTAVFLLSFWQLLSPFMAPGSREARKGARSYDRGAWERAVDHYTQARRDRDDPVLDYNLGASAYRDSSYQAAADAFTAAQRSETLAPGRAAFNLGNARYRGGDLKGALEAYRSALRADPDYADARYNYELTRKELQANPRKQQKNQKGNQGQDRNGQGQKGEGQKGEGQKSPPDSTGTSKPEPSPGDRNSKDQEQNAQDQADNRDQQEKDQDAAPEPAAEADSTGKKQDQPGQPGQPARLLTPQEAAQLLNQITPEERELLRARLKSTHRRKAEKDW